MGLDVFAHIFIEERIARRWEPVRLVRALGTTAWSEAAIEEGVGELDLPYEELGDVGYRALHDFATLQFGLKDGAEQSRGLPVDVSGALRVANAEARDQALTEMNEMADDAGDPRFEEVDLSEGWLELADLPLIDWSRSWPEVDRTYRQLLGASLFAQLARVQSLGTDRELRLVHWFTI